MPDGDYTIPFGQADVKRQGNDVTIVASGPMVGKSLEAADMLAQSGIDVEVVDVRTLMPLDKQTIFASVEKTNRVIVTDEEAKRGGASAEIASLIAEECFDALDGETRGGRECPDSARSWKSSWCPGLRILSPRCGNYWLVRRTAIAPPVWRGAFSSRQARLRGLPLA